MKKIITAVALSLPLFTQAAVLDMVPLLKDDFGNIHLVEREFYDYGTKENNFKYKGTRWIVQDPVGRYTLDTEIYFDCQDSTYGVTVPTTEDIPAGTVIHAIYRKACGK